MVTVIGDLSWTGALVLFLEALDGGPAGNVAGYAFESSGDLEFSATISDALLGSYRCVAKTAGGVLAGVGYVTIEATTTTMRIRAEETAALAEAIGEIQATLEKIPQEGKTFRYRRTAFDQEGAYTDTAIETAEP